MEEKIVGRTSKRPGDVQQRIISNWFNQQKREVWVSNICREVIQQIKLGDKFVRVTEEDRDSCKMRKQLTMNLCLQRTKKFASNL
jgi:hypothetical protein